MGDGDQLHATVAANIRTRRQALGISQEILADRCNLHRTYIGAIERAERNITINTLARVAQALGCTPIDLLTTSSTGTS